MPTWPQILDFLRSYGPAIGLALTWGGIILAWWRRRRSWRQKSFIRQVNFSLNDIQHGTLTLRTLLEDDAKKVWLNDYGVGLVLDAAAHTTVKQPFIAMRTEADQGYVLRAALNVLSERFAELHVARTLGVAAKSAEYVFGLTCEKYGDIRTRKLRVIIARPDLLESLFGPRPSWAIPADGATEAAGPSPEPAPEPTPATRTLRLEHRVHKDRLDTLRVMHRLWTSDKPRERAMLDTVELGLAE